MATLLDVSNLLDIIGASPGMILYRDQEVWRALAPGQPGQVLLIDSEGIPFWGDSP